MVCGVHPTRLPSYCSCIHWSAMKAKSRQVDCVVLSTVYLGIQAGSAGFRSQSINQLAAISAVNFSILFVALPTVFEFLNLLAQTLDFITQLLYQVFEALLVGLFFIALSHIPDMPPKIFRLL